MKPRTQAPVLRLSLLVLATTALTDPTAYAQNAVADTRALAKYDVNKNGRLDPDELIAQQADEAKAAKVSVTTTDPVSAPPSEVVQMSPFEVTADGDRGYYGANTMSGTRVNSKLEDLAASISVVTKKQMEDLALLDMNDLFNYEANTEGTGNYTDFSFDRNGLPIDNTQLNPGGANRIRGIGSANINFGSFETSGRTPIDPIAIDAVEISRGPNSNIFGIGSSAGTVNTVPSSANLRKNKTQVAMRVDSFEGYRGSIDLNRVLKPGVLAVRGSAVFQHDGYDLKPSGTDTKRYNGMLKYQPFKTTTITGSFGYYHTQGNRPNATTPRENITNWRKAGSPTWNPVTGTATINGIPGQPKPDSLQTLPALMPVITVDRSGITYWTPYRTSLTNTPTGLNGPRTLYQSDRAMTNMDQPMIQDRLPASDKAMYDWSRFNLAAPNRIADKSEIASVLLDQIFLSSERHLLSAQLGWFRESSERYARNLIGQPSAVSVLQIDVNETRLDGSPNPNLLRPFINNLAIATTDAPADRDTYRGQVAYKLDLTKMTSRLRWLGRHELTGYVEDKNFKSWGRNWRDAIVDDHAWLSPGVARAADGAFGGLPAASSGVARGHFYFYLGDNQGQNVDYGAPNFTNGTYPMTWGNSTTGVFVQEPAKLGLAANSGTGGGGNQWTVQRTQGAVLQSHLLGGRIVPTFGLRRDARYTKSGGTPLLQQDGATIDENSFLSWAPAWAEGKGVTKTAGVVLKPFRWLSVYLNKSDSFQPASPAVNLYQQGLPDPSGEGRDYGIMLNLLGGKLFVRANVYNTDAINSRQGQIATIGTRLLFMDRVNVIGQSATPRAFNLQVKATEWVLAAAAAQGQTLSNDQVLARMAQITGLSVESYFPMQQTSSTSDITARGKEIEINYNPTTHWTMKLNVTQQESIDNHLAPDVTQWLEERLKVWPGIIDPTTGRPWFTSVYPGSNDSASTYLASSVIAPLRLEIARQGLPRPRVRKYRANFVTNFHLAAMTEHRLLKRVNVGGSLRWEDKASIGFYGKEKPPVEITALDPFNPIFDEARLYADVFVGYRTRLFREKVGATFQLNVRNVAESGRLQPIAADPDGTTSGFRIISPRQFILSVTFDL